MNSSVWEWNAAVPFRACFVPIASLQALFAVQTPYPHQPAMSDHTAPASNRPRFDQVRDDTDYLAAP